MADWITIANLALRRLGQERIADLDEDSEPARNVKDCRDVVLGAVLQLHPWNCALARALLPAAGAAPAFGWSCAYNLPADCLRVLRIDEDPKARFAREGRQILCDVAAPLKIRYIKRVENPELFDPLLVATLAAALAAWLAYKLTQSREKESDMEALLKQQLTFARTTDAQEGTIEAPIEGDFLTARR